MGIDLIALIVFIALLLGFAGWRLYRDVKRSR